MNKKSLAVSLGLMAALAPGCATEMESLEGEAVNVADFQIARIELPNGNHMEIYEPTPGDYLIGESFTADAPPLSAQYDLSAMSLAEVHALALPDAAVPQALVAADARHAALLEQGATVGIAEAARQVDTPLGRGDMLDVLTPLAVPRAVDWFVRNHCNTWHPKDFEYCHTERTGDGTIYVADVNGTKATVYPYRGSLTFTFQYRTWWSWDTYLSKSLSEGNGWYVTRSRAVDYDIRSKVTNASGDGYHHAVHGVKSGATAHYYD